MRLYWTPIAMGHLRAAYEYVARENAVGAETLVEQIFAVVERLEQYPRMGRAGRVDGTRELVIAGTAFVVVYRVAGERVEVLRGAACGA